MKTIRKILLSFEQSYSDAFTDPEEGIDYDGAEMAVEEALKEISELLLECKPKDWGGSYNEALDDYEKNIKARLQ